MSLAKPEKCKSCKDAKDGLSQLSLSSSSTSLSNSVDLFASDDTTYFDQGMWGSCTAFAMKYALVLYAKTRPLSVENVSAAYLYAESRKVLGLPVRHDSGSSNWATTMATKQGLITESQMPYYASNIFTDPLTLSLSPVPGPSFKNFVFSAVAATNLTNLKTVLSTRPIIIAIVMYKSSMTQNALVTGLIPLPSAADLRSGPVGQHAICLTGYNSTHFIFRNSWGTDVGLKGSFRLPYAYLTTSKKGRMSYVSDAYFYE